jgi:aminobenzoyl-glutamate transport protein
MDSIVTFIFLTGAGLGLAYGIGAGTVHSDSDVARAMAKAMEAMSVYLVIVFFASQFVAYFNWTNVGLILAVKGAEVIRAAGLSTGPLAIAFVLVSSIMNLFVGSGSAKWAVMAPVFVPMFMLLGYAPEFTQAAYRIGDSVTNVMSPGMAYFALVLAFFQRYDKNAGIGTLVATMLPYAVSFLAVWIVLLLIWAHVGLPLGPGVGVYLR